MLPNVYLRMIDYWINTVLYSNIILMNELMN
jgi:hypothetical protein